VIVLLIGTLDTKGAEVAYVRDRLTAAGVSVLVADAGVLGLPAFPPDIPRQELFAAAGVRFDEIRRLRDRGRAVTEAAAGAARLAERLYRDGRIHGILGLGGSAGTTIATAAMRALPLGVPKLMISTLASGNVRPYVGNRDILMFPSVVDLAGLNRISRVILDNAASAMIGMITHAAISESSTVASTQSGTAQASASADKPIIAATMFGVTTPAVEAARGILEAAGFEVLVFHATGIGGATMEGLIRDGLVAGVLDLTTTELADQLVGGVMAAGPDRLTAAGLVGIPQVISLGALDMVNFGPRETVPPQFSERRFYQHNPNVTLMRTTPEENDRLGKEIAEKASASRGPTAVLLPLRGVSAIDREGEPFWWPEADAALFQSIRQWTHGVELIECDAHINDPLVAEVAAKKLLEYLGKR